MKKLFALLLAMMMVLSLAACGGGDDKPGSTPKPSSSSQQQEQNTPDPDPVEDETEQTPDPDEGSEDDDNGVTVADCNAALDEMGITNFRFPEDLTAVQCKVYGLTGSNVDVRYCPVEQDRYEEILQSLFSDTGLTTTDQFGDTITTLDEAKGATSVADRPNHGFNLTGNDRTFYVSVYYYPTEYDDMIEVFEAKTLSITIREVSE